MKKVITALLALTVFSTFLCVCVCAEDQRPPAQILSDAERWSGFYAGLDFAVGQSNARWKNPTGYLQSFSEYTSFPSRSSRGGFLGGFNIGYDWAMGKRWIAGVAGDFEAINLTNLTNCASQSTSIGFICRSEPESMVSLRSRIGRTEGNWLFYLTGGLAYINETVAISAFNPNGYGAANAYNSTRRTRSGGVYGAGIETFLGDNLTAKLEFVQYRFGLKAFSNTDMQFNEVYGASTEQTLSFVKMGISYRFAAPAYMSATPPHLADDLSGEFGLRSGWAHGSYRYDLYSSKDHSYMISRLSWPGSGMMTELFGRLDHTSGVYLKGFIGGIFLRNGDEMHDQDFLAINAQEDSDTVSIRRDSRSYYGTADLGYAFRGQGWRAGPFFGYNRFEENQNAYGCVQTLDNQEICPSRDGVNYVGAEQLILSRKAAWDALRLGAAGDIMLTDRIRLSAETAWLPLISISGSIDNHWMRPGINPLKNIGKGRGHGWQTEAWITCRLTRQLSIGTGLRIWRMRARGENQFTGYENISPTREFIDRTMAIAQISYSLGQNYTRRTGME